jgi:hypothetical protein
VLLTTTGDCEYYFLYMLPPILIPHVLAHHHTGWAKQTNALYATRMHAFTHTRISASAPSSVGPSTRTVHKYTRTLYTSTHVHKCTHEPHAKIGQMCKRERALTTSRQHHGHMSKLQTPLNTAVVLALRICDDVRPPRNLVNVRSPFLAHDVRPSRILADARPTFPP